MTPARKPDALDALDDTAQDWPQSIEQAVYVLETVTAPAWESLAALARAHVSGRLSYDAWRTATREIITSAARCAVEEAAA